MISLQLFHSKIHNKRVFIFFTWITRIALAIGFIPSGLTKLLGNKFTLLTVDNPVGLFFEALYRTGYYWNFLGLMQLLAALLLLIPRTTLLGAILYFPIILNIFIIVVSMGFKGTPYITGLMLFTNLYLLFWDYDKLSKIVSILFRKQNA